MSPPLVTRSDFRVRGSTVFICTFYKNLGPTSAKHRRSRFWRGEEKVARLIEGLQLRTILINDWQGRLRPTDPLYAGSHSSRLITDDRFWRQTGRSLRLSPAVGYAPKATFDDAALAELFPPDVQASVPPNGRSSGRGRLPFATFVAGWAPVLKSVLRDWADDLPHLPSTAPNPQ
jgi:hypothetical protein